MRVSRSIMYFISFLFLLSACQNNNNSISGHSQIPVPVILPAPAEHPVSYTKEIRPILETKCLSCHSCFDAPCQLKLENAQGLLRGAFHESIYGG